MTMEKECKQSMSKKEIAKLPKVMEAFDGAVIGNQFMSPHVKSFPLTELGKASHVLMHRLKLSFKQNQKI